MSQVLQSTIREFDLERLLLKAGGTLHRWFERAAQRRDLAELDQHALRDIGVSRRQALNEARKPFWWS